MQDFCFVELDTELFRNIILVKNVDAGDTRKAEM
jgi:hypothetical protein